MESALLLETVRDAGRKSHGQRCMKPARVIYMVSKGSILEKFLMIFLDQMLGPAAALSFLNKQGWK